MNGSSGNTRGYAILADPIHHVQTPRMLRRDSLVVAPLRHANRF